MGLQLTEKKIYKLLSSSLLIPIHFSVLTLKFGPIVAKYLTKDGALGFLNICSIYLIPNVYPYLVCHLTHIYFRVQTLNFGFLVAKYLPENGVSWIFLNV